MPRKYVAILISILHLTIVLSCWWMTCWQQAVLFAPLLMKLWITDAQDKSNWRVSSIVVAGNCPSSRTISEKPFRVADHCSGWPADLKKAMAKTWFIWKNVHIPCSSSTSIAVILQKAWQLRSFNTRGASRKKSGPEKISSASRIYHARRSNLSWIPPHSLWLFRHAKAVLRKFPFSRDAWW